MAHDLEERAVVETGDTVRAVRIVTWWTHWGRLAGWCRARRWWAGLVATIAVSVGLRLWALDVLPGEIYGDIVIVWDYLLQVREERWPFHYVLSFGPLFPYLAAPIVWVTGMTYWGLKIASVVVSLWMLGAVYLLGRELLKRELGLLSVFIAGTSSWLLVFSRIGHQIIVVPLLTTLALAFVARTIRTGQTWPIVASAVTAALGLYVYAASFILPVAVAATLLALWGTCRAIRLRHFLLFGVVTLIASVPFARLVARDPQNFLSGYIGGKFVGNPDPLGALLHNLWLSLLALHVRGDVIFRSNPSGLPHLDRLSGLLLLAGLVFWFRSERRALSPILLVPFTLLQVPAMLSINFPGEVPSASRTLAIAPLAAILVASGVHWGWELFRSRPALARWAPPALGIVLVAILTLNIERYFVRYTDGLPDHNTPFGRIIATWADSLPVGTQVFVVGCCWGAWGQPEPKGILYAMAWPERFHHVELRSVDCDWVATLDPPAAVVWRPDLELPTPGVRPCLSGVSAATHMSPRGQPVFRAVSLPPSWRPPTVAGDTAAHPETAIGVADEYVRANQIDKAAEVLRAAASLRPRDIALQHKLGDVEALLGNSDAAIAAWTTAVQIEASASNLNKLGAGAVALQRWDTAIAALTQTLERDPGMHVAHFYLGEALRGRGNASDAQGARDAYRRYLTESGQNAPFRLQAGAGLRALDG